MNGGVLADVEAVVASVRSPEVFTVVFDRHYDAIARYLGRRLDAEIADELAAETFVQAFRVRDRYDASRPNVRAWLLGIATRLAGRQHRSEARRLRAYARAAVPPGDDGELCGADARVDAQALSVALARGLASLSGADRDVVALYAWGDLSYEEIAATLQIPIGTVRSRLHRARQRLRATLEAAGTREPTATTAGEEA